MKFNEFNLDERLLKAIDDLGFVECTEVQEKSLAHTLEGRDVTAQSQTGTGKTAAFLITILQHYITKPELAGRQALVVTPTRELAVQIEEEAKLIGKYLPYRAGSIYGGVGYGPQEQMLRDNVEIIVGTPGRLIDLSKSGKLDFGNFATVVIDEADRLFDMGFYPDIRYMLQRTPPKDKRLTLLFSATLSTSVRNISWQYMNDPAEIEVHPERMTVDEVDQVLYHVARDEKIALLLGLLKKEQPQNALVFTNTKRAAELVAKKLKGNGYPCEFIMGDVPQRKRLRIINNLKSGDVPYLVATDVAARGLHIEDLDLVVNFDLPEDVESYVHRIGRTARAGRTGKAVSLACERFVFSLEAIEGFVGFKIPVGEVSDDLFVKDQSHVSVRDLQYHGDSGGSRGRGPKSRSRGSSGRSSGGRSGSSRSGSPRSDGHSRRAPSEKPNSRSNDRPQRAAKPAGDRPQRAAKPAGDRPQRAAKPAGDRPQRAAKPAGDRPRSSSKPARASETSDSRDRRPSKATSMDERLEYYKEKYGEDFQHTGSTAGGSRGQSQGSGKKDGGNSSHDGRSQGPRSQGDRKRAAKSPGGKSGTSRGSRSGAGRSGTGKSGSSADAARTGKPSGNRSGGDRRPERTKERPSEASRKPETGESVQKRKGIFGAISKLFGKSADE